MWRKMIKTNENEKWNENSEEKWRNWKLKKKNDNSREEENNNEEEEKWNEKWIKIKKNKCEILMKNEE